MMQRSIEKEGKTLEEATECALKELGAKREDVDVEVLEDGKSGFLGFGTRSAKVRVTFIANAKDVLQKNIHDDDAGQNRFQEETSSEEVLTKTEEFTADPKEVKELLLGLLERMQMDGTIETRVHDGRVMLNVIGKDSNLLIGKKGQTLDAVQYLINLMYSKAAKKKTNVVIDVEEYKIRREKRLQSIAMEIREKVKRTHKPVAIAPMNAQDRRIIHLTLQNDDFVKTLSKGEGPLRKVVVIPK